MLRGIYHLILALLLPPFLLAPAHAASGSREPASIRKVTSITGIAE